MQATPEQAAICACRAYSLKIKAFAGTGKTTTLRGLAARYPQERILYLAFNKAIKEEAQGRFVKNVRAMTAHGLAFASVGKHYANTPNKLHIGDLKPFHVLPHLAASLKKIPAPAHNLYGARVIEAIRNYLISADLALSADHVVVGQTPLEKKHFGRDRVLADAELIWAIMQDLKGAVPMIHDGYLKMFQRDQSDLGYGLIMVDEYQDTNPVLQALVEHQACRKVYVGDEHQAIYGFRGARNAMASTQAEQDFFLTGSFRFGAPVAQVANFILGAKGETLQLRGMGPASVVGHLPPNTPHAFIARGNSALFGRAVQAIEKNEAFSFVGPLYNYRLDLIEQVYRLSTGGTVNDPFLKAFKDFEELEAYAEAMDDREIMGRCKLVTRYGGRIPGLIAHIQAKAGTFPGPGHPQVILTSAHRAKGLEFDHVQLSDDFMDFYDDNAGGWKDLTRADAREQEEVNLQYVAATRAKLTLEVGEKLGEFLTHAKEEQAKQLRREQNGVDDPIHGRVSANAKRGTATR